MSRRGHLPGAALILLLVAGPVRGGELASFQEPAEGAILLGPTQFRFAAGGGVERIDVYVDGRLVGTALPPEWSFSWEAPAGLVGVPIVGVVYRNGTVVEKLRIRTSEAAFGEELVVTAVQLYPVVTDRRGRYVVDLEASDFVVFDEGREMELEIFSREVTSLTLAILLDVSASMEGKLAAVQAASSRFVDQLEAGDLVSVFAFNHALQPAVAGTTDRGRIKTTIHSFSAAGGTALYDAVVGVLQTLEDQPGRKVIVLFSDGQDERSLTSLARTAALARASEVIVYALGAGESAADLAAREDLRLLAGETGGQAYFLDRMKALPATFDAVLQDLRSQYLLSYTAPEGPPGLRRVVVQVTDGSLQVRCRKVYEYRGPG